MTSLPAKRTNESAYDGEPPRETSEAKRRRVEGKQAKSNDDDDEIPCAQPTPAVLRGLPSPHAKWQRGYRCPLKDPDCFWSAPVELGLEPFGNLRLQQALFDHFQQRDHAAGCCPWCHSEVQHDQRKCRLYWMKPCPQHCYGYAEITQGKDAYCVMERLPEIHKEKCAAALFEKRTADSVEDTLAQRKDISGLTDLLLQDEQPDRLDFDTAEFLINHVLSLFVGSNAGKSADDRSDEAISLLIKCKGHPEAVKLLGRHYDRSPVALQKQAAIAGAVLVPPPPSSPPAVPTAAAHAPSFHTASVPAKKKKETKESSPSPLVSMRSSSWAAAAAASAPAPRPFSEGAGSGSAAFVSAPVVQRHCRFPPCPFRSVDTDRMKRHEASAVHILHRAPEATQASQGPPSTYDLVASAAPAAAPAVKVEAQDLTGDQEDGTMSPVFFRR